MSSIVYLSAAIGILGGWSSVSIAQSSPSAPAAGGTAVTTPTPNFAGTWDAITRSYGGIGSTTLFSPDSTSTLVLGAMVEVNYKIEGNKITLFSDQPGNKFSETQDLKFVDGSPVLSGNGCSRKLKRLGAADANSGLVGSWQSMHMTGVPAYEEYTRDGLARLRVPIQVQKGTFSITGNTVAFRTLLPRREDWSAQFSLKGDTLTFSIGGEQHNYLRARDLIPFDVQQPAKPAGLVC